MQEATLAQLEILFLALSDKTRLRLLALMAGGEVPVGLLADSLGESQPKISRHLAYLRNAGLVSTRRDGKWIYYYIQQPEDFDVERILNVTINSVKDSDTDNAPVSFAENKLFNKNLDENDQDIYADAYETEYEPNEMEVFLL